MKDSGLKREDIFLSTKLWPSEYENAVDETLERLGVDYVDDCVIIGLNRKSLIESRFSRRSPISLTGKGATSFARRVS